MEVRAFRQHDRGRAHRVRRRIEAIGLLALRHRECGLAQAHARHDHAVVGRDQILLAAILDRPAALLDRGVLHGDAFDAAIRLVVLLRHAVDHVVVVFVDHRAERAGNEIDVDAAAVAHDFKLVRRERPRRMVGEAPRHAVLVVDRHEGVAVERVVAIRRDHGVERHDPLGDAPVEIARRRRPAHADHHAALVLDDLETHGRSRG